MNATSVATARVAGPSARGGASEAARLVVTPDLADRAPPLARHFPLIAAGTTLVLADGAPGRVRVFWQLTEADLTRAMSGFRGAGSRPVPVLRLRQRYGDAAELVGEVRLRLADAARGEHGFLVESRPARYDAELGLSDLQGGWILLARSNGLDHAAQIGLRLVPRMSRAEMSDQGAATTTAHQGSARWHAAGEALDRATSGQGAVPLAMTSAAVAGPDARAAGQGRRLNGELVDLAARLGLDESPKQIKGDQIKAEQIQGAGMTAAPDLAARDVSSSPAVSRSLVQPTLGASIQPLRYGQPTPAAESPVIEAKLVITGRARPGLLIDLFGHPYRVGPGGRFRLVVQVEDADLVRQALAQHPLDLPDRDAEALVPPSLDRSGAVD